MSGKAYTMKEMKGIVEYLIEHKAYKEIRGRKMWTDFANSQLTNRTWQSLKETFLKRILPDINNPYYKLTLDEIRSFKQGYDVKEREKNKLEIQTISEDSSLNADNQKESEQPKYSEVLDEEKTSGEENKLSKISSRDRASIETVIIENCYETAEDIQKVLDSPTHTSNDIKEVQQAPSKSLRDLITYSEPLTPMLQEVLHDFDTDEDSDGGDPKMVIVEQQPDLQEQEIKSPEQIQDTQEISPRKIPDNIQKSPWLITETTGKSPKSVVNQFEKSSRKTSDQVEKSENVQNPDINAEEGDDFIQPRIKSLRLRKKQANGNKYIILSEMNKETESGNTETVDSENKVSTKNDFTKKDEPSPITIHKESDIKEQEITKSLAESTQSCSNSTPDTLLPNNQEALEISEKQINNKTTLNPKEKNMFIRKRASSQEVTSNLNSKKKNKNEEPTEKQISVSDTDAGFKKSITENGVKFKVEGNKNLIRPSETQGTNIVSGNEPFKNVNKDTADVTQPSQINPCLQSVSLFAEQYNLPNCIDSDSSDEGNITKNTIEKTANGSTKAAEFEERNKKDLNNKVVILKSHSDSDSNQSLIEKNNSEKKVLMKSQRDKALASVFGFSSGAVTSKRKNSLHKYHRSNSSDSSEWTSESDFEYVSPPRGRRNKKARKFLKPQSARIHSLEKEGGLFVMYGKKIYPLVKDGRSIKNYLTYDPESDSNEEDNYWKQKYVEQTHKIQELKKLIIQQDSVSLPSNLPRKSESLDRELPSKTIADNGSVKTLVPPSETDYKQPPIVNKTLKITFAKNNQEVHLEGHWSQLHPVLADVVEIFHKDVESKEAPIKEGPKRSIEEASDMTSVVLVPSVDDEVHEKVNKIETEIFKEIEERADEEVESKEGSEMNVTKRKRLLSRSRTPSTSNLTNNTNQPSPSVSRSSKRLKIAAEKSDVEKPIENIEQHHDSIDSKTSVTKKQTRTPKKRVEPREAVVASRDTKSKGKKSKIQIPKELKKSEDYEDSETRYMFPPTKSSNKKNTANVSKVKEQQSNQYCVGIPKIYISPNLSLNSDSTQGYLDSDVSPPNIWPRRKRKLSTVLYRNQKNKHQRLRIKSNLNKVKDLSNHTSTIPNEKPKDETSLNSEVYRSDSYQLLMQERKNPFKILEKIDEDIVAPNDNMFSTSPNSEDPNEILHMNLSKFTNDVVDGNIDCANSSNVSLPLSPELSIVENLSISKELVSSINRQPTLNEIQANNITDNVINNKYLISQVDVTMPLMQQVCKLGTSLYDNMNPDYSINESPMKTAPLLNKTNNDKIDEAQTLSESLDIKLKNLLLESAKKMTEENKRDNAHNKEIKKARAAKRCSTPRKRKEAKKTKPPITIDPVVEEEHMETCSYGGRKSCPPSILVINNENSVNDKQNYSDKAKSIAKKKPTEKKKKDIIKVKILRPKDKSPKNIEISPKSDKSLGKEKLRAPKRKSIPVGGDSGINETESLSSSQFNDSVDLIHNHSETCLHANECIGDSVEFIETTGHSIISINSNSAASFDSVNQQILFEECKEISSEKYNNAKNFTNGNNDTEILHRGLSENTCETLYQSPSDKSMNSLITDDLSEEPSPPPSCTTNWYLLSEDDTRTNLCPQSASGFGFASNLKQLFPITCAVPDLSTITEISKDENSRKPTLDFSICDSNTVNELNSQNIIDMN